MNLQASKRLFGINFIECSDHQLTPVLDLIPVALDQIGNPQAPSEIHLNTSGAWVENPNRLSHPLDIFGEQIWFY